MTATVALSAALLTAAWTISWQRLEAESASVNVSSQVRQESLAALISENLAQILDRGRLLALAATEIFEGNRKNSSARLSAMVSADRAFLRIALYDDQLRRTYTSSPADDSDEFTAAIGASLEQFQGHQPANIRIAPLFKADEQAWQIPLLFPVINSTGEARGILLVVLDLGYLLGLYQDIDIGPSGAIQILQSSGEELARARQSALEFPQKTWRNDRFSQDKHQSGSLVMDLFADGRSDQVSYKHLAHYPFIVVISREMEELRADLRGRRARFLLILQILTLVVLVATFWIASVMKRQERLFDELATADLDKRKLIQQLEEEKRVAFELASHDYLTGLPNRRMFQELGASHLHQAKRSRQHYGLLYVDLDRFKAVNDTLGHHVGDLLLQTVATRLRSTLRESDVIARLGGDEFAVLLTGRDSEDLVAIAGKIVEVISRPCTNLDGHDVQVSPSIGIALFPRDGHNVETLSRHADAAMYQSKQTGRGRYTFYDSELNRVSNRLFDLEQRLPQAIAEDELVLHYQPKIRLADYRIVGFEALVRWQHPEQGLIPPDEFIPMAENTGLIIELGDWVLEACCKQLARWQAEGLEPVPVAINVSARQLQDERLPERIAACLAAYKVTPGYLAVEITESSLVQSIEVAGKVLDALAGSGVTIALDDFGNGYSSLAYMRTLPIHVIKIDRSFINNIRNKPDDDVIVASIVTLAHNLKMRVVAEGVELLDQLIHLKTLGCDEVQGYFLSRPVPSDAARQLLVKATLLPQNEHHF